MIIQALILPLNLLISVFFYGKLTLSQNLFQCSEAISMFAKLIYFFIRFTRPPDLSIKWSFGHMVGLHSILNIEYTGLLQQLLIKLKCHSSFQN